MVPTVTPSGLSIIVPTLNEGDNLSGLLRQLRPWREAGDEIIVVDGDSSDGSLALIGALADQTIVAERGRARQMNAGAAAAHGRVFWFLHADSQVNIAARHALLARVSAPETWGRFDISIADARWPFRVIESMMNARSHWSGIATGDQGLFISRTLFERVGGYPPIALMEDVEICKALKRIRKPHCLTARIATSSRRWRERGVVRTVLLMWALRLAWFCGARADRLARIYGYR